MVILFRLTSYVVVVLTRRFSETAVSITGGNGEHFVQQFDHSLTRYSQQIFGLVRDNLYCFIPVLKVLNHTSDCNRPVLNVVSSRHGALLSLGMSLNSRVILLHGT